MAIELGSGSFGPAAPGVVWGLSSVDGGGFGGGGILIGLGTPIVCVGVCNKKELCSCHVRMFITTPTLNS